MYINSLAAVLILALCSLMKAPSASAADFYMLSANTTGEDYSVVLLDPQSIEKLAGGHRVAVVATIHGFDIWQTSKLEIDCANRKLKVLSATSHLSGGNVIEVTGSQSADWEPTKSDTVGGQTYDAVCLWASSKLTGQRVYSADDLPKAEHQISDRIDQLTYQKK